MFIFNEKSLVQINPLVECRGIDEIPNFSQTYASYQVNHGSKRNVLKQENGISEKFHNPINDTS